MERESATCTCLECWCRFRVLADEWGMHSCPGCGAGPDREEEDDDGHE